MTICFENETDQELDFDYENILEKVIRQAAEPEPQQDVMETEFPSVEEPDPVPIEDFDRWSDPYRPQFIQKETHLRTGSQDIILY